MKNVAKVTNFPAHHMAKGVHTFFPEMKEHKPNCQMEATLAHYGKHYFVDTPLELKGRGITHLQTYKGNEFTKPGHKAGWHEYKVTARAFEKLKEQYSISMVRYLD